jgi:hypothetical protein
MGNEIDEIVIKGVTYVPKGSENTLAENVDDMPFVLIRGYGSGVQFGYLKSRNGCEVELINSRRIWSWNGATDTNQIDVSGIDNGNSKVTVVVPHKIITDAIEIMTLTKIAADNLSKTSIWKK